jgi:hypothetical protein
MTRRLDAVGPVLESGEVANAVIAAIRALNEDVEVEDRGSYKRVLVRDRCVVTRQAIERVLCASFELPSDLERIMPSFKGRLTIDANRAEWGPRR